MKLLGYLAVLFALSTSISAETNCEKTVNTWVKKTIEFVRCLGIENSTANISLRICSYTAQGTSSEYVTLLFESKLEGKNCTNTTYAKPCTNDVLTVNDLGDIAADIDENLEDVHESDDSDKDNVFYVAKNLTTSQENLYKSNHSRTSVDAVTFDDKTNLTGARMAMNDKKIDGLTSAEPLDAQLNGSPDSRLSSILQMYGDRVMGLSFFDMDNEEIRPKRVVMSIDISGADKGYLCRKAMDKAILLEQVSISTTSCKELTPLCAFEQNGSWPSTGCTVLKSTDKEVTCECNHTTVFAVLMATTVVSVPHSVKIVSYVAEVITIIFLLVTVFLLAKVRNRIRGDRVKVQICVASSLLCLHVLNIFHDAALSNDTICVIFAVLIHYFLLCTACWMLMEGVTLLFKTMNSVMRILNGQNARKFSIFRYVFSFSVPAVIVIISASIGFSESGPPDYMAVAPNLTGYPQYSQCWVGEDFRVGAVIVPISTILFCCLLIIARMFYVVFRMSAESENFKPTSQRRQTTSGDLPDIVHIKAALKATLVLVPVLGIPWYLALLVETSEVLMFTNAVVNGLQGMMVFFVYCVIGKEVRKAIWNSYSRKMYSLSSNFEFSSKQRRMTNEHSSNTAQATMSTNIADNFTEGDRNSNKSADGTSVEKF